MTLFRLILKSCLAFFNCSCSVWVIILHLLIFFLHHNLFYVLISVQGPRCRYAIGRILSEGEDEPDEELIQRCEGSGFKVFSFPYATHVVTTSLPCRTVFSVPVGVGRVYPKLEHYIKVHTDPLVPPQLLSVHCFYCTMI